MAEQRPILVTGAPRSGTTFLGAMLALPPEVGYIHEPLSAQHGLAGLAALPGPVPHVVAGGPDEALVAEQVSDLLAGRARFRRPSYPGDGRLRRTARDAVGAWPLRQYRRARWDPRRRRWLLKDPWAVFSAEWLHRSFDMQTVVITRHPVAVVRSCLRLGWRFPLTSLTADEQLVVDHLKAVFGDLDLETVGPVENAALYWAACNAALGDYLDRNPAMIHVRHEELSADPVGTLRVLYHQLGLTFDRRVERRVRRHTDGDVAASSGLHRALRRNNAEVAPSSGAADPDLVDRVRVAVGEVADRFYPT